MVEETRPSIELPKIQPVELLPIRSEDSTIQAVAENLRRIEDTLKDFGGRADPMVLLASILGGVAITADVPASTATGEDLRLPHGLARTPSMVVVQVDTMGTAGQLYAAPAGGSAALGQNETPWTRDELFVRATVSSRYRFVVV